MNLVNELMEASKKPKRLPYDQWIIERDRITNEFQKHFRSNREIHVDRFTLEIEAPGDVYRLTNSPAMEKLPVKFGKVFGNFDVNKAVLTTLENGPYFVGGNFNAQFNLLTSTAYLPKYIGKNCNLGWNKLSAPEVKIEGFKGNLDLSSNPLTSLKGLPKTIDMLDLPTSSGYSDKVASYGVLRLPMLTIGEVLFVSPVSDSLEALADKLGRIVNKHLNKGRPGVLALQNELIDEGLEQYARFD